MPNRIYAYLVTATGLIAASALAADPETGTERPQTAPGHSLVHEEFWESPPDDPGQHVDRAREAFLAVDGQDAANELRKAAAKLRVSAGQAAADTKGALVRSARELESLARRIEEGTVKTVADFDRASAVALRSLFPVHAYTAGDPAQTVRQSEQVLADLLAIPGRQIPRNLLADAQGVAVIPGVTKIGFIAGVRRGHGVVLVRDSEGEWSLPQFITLTGGSVGWQAGIQETDVVLVFKTRKGVEGLMKGKFTIGVDASVSAGPVGRDAEAATDAALKAEILSYSRSRGLFVGVSIDGSGLEIDPQAHVAFYGSPTGEMPRRLPESASWLRNYLVELIQVHPVLPVSGESAPHSRCTIRREALRRSLIHNEAQLQGILSPAWRQYLALPEDILEPAAQPDLEALTAVRQRFAKVESSPMYRDLAGRTEFQTTHELLREYIDALSASWTTLHLAAPPVN